MLLPRIIPCLLVKDKGLVKTVNFKKWKYVGDPINAVRIFNEKMVDELIVLDIDATVKNQVPDYKMIERLAAECRMPLCYGGGVKNVLQAKTILNLGVEKISLSSAAIYNVKLVRDISETIGKQSTIVTVDVKKRLFSNQYDVYTYNASCKCSLNLLSFIQKIETLGVGEIIVNSIDNDGVMKGYDWNLIDQVRKVSNVPITIIGGAGSLDDIRALFQHYGIVGAAAGSLFVFKGKYKAVLINYPDFSDKAKLVGSTY